MVLSLAACAHQSIRSQPLPELTPARTAADQPIAPRPVPAPASAPVVEPPVEPSVVEPGPPPVPQLAHEAEQPQKATLPRPAPSPKKTCNPMSRAGCRWDQEGDERFIQRVVKKKQQQESP